jgi:ornithine decarboxylase
VFWKIKLHTFTSKMTYRSVAKLNYDYTEKIIQSWMKTLPYIQPFYAVKSFPNKDFLKFLSNYAGVGYDCASKKEIQSVISGISGISGISITPPIIFANPTKSIKDIQYATYTGVHLYVVDSIEEIQKIQTIDTKARYVIRILSDELYSAIKFNKKFGASYEEVQNIIDYISLQNLHLEGFSYHVGSKCSNMKAHIQTINIILAQYLPYCNDKHIYPTIIDIGGGFESEQQLIELDEQLTDPEENILQNIQNRNLRLIAEPGRLFSQGVLEIYTKIIAIREKVVDNIRTLYITINDSVYHSFQGKIYDGQTYEPIPFYESEGKEFVRCVIFGQTCDSIDMIVENSILPYPKLGDTLLFTNMGSYSLASATGNFNGFACAQIVSNPTT